MNIIELAQEKGFKSGDVLFDRHFSWKNGWFGVTTTHPDAILKLGNLEIQISLEGIDASMDRDCCAERFLEKEADGVYRLRAKRIALYKDNKLFYKSCGGEMPDEQTIINFFKS